MRRRLTFTVAFAVLVVAQVAVLAYWSSLRPPPSRIRDQIKVIIKSLRTRALQLEECATSIEGLPGRFQTSQVFRQQAATNRQLADRLAADPEDGVSTVLSLYMMEHGRIHMAMVREGGCRGPSKEVE